MSRKDVWETDLFSARKRWEDSKDTGDYEVYAMACAAYLSSKEFENSNEHWFCASEQTRRFAISSLIMFSFTVSGDKDDPANTRYKAYEDKFTRMLASCQKCSIAYQCCDKYLMYELIDEAGIQENRVLAFFKELHRKDRLRLAFQLKANPKSVAVLTEILWSYACMTVSTFVNENLVNSGVLTGKYETIKNVGACPGFLLLSFMNKYDVRQTAMKPIVRPENIDEFLSAWRVNPERFSKLFHHGLKRNIHAEYYADFAWYTAAMLIGTFADAPDIRDSCIEICVTEMKSARGLPAFGAQLLVLKLLKYAAATVLQPDIEAIMDYATKAKSLKFNAVDQNAPNVVRASTSYAQLSASIVSEWFRMYISTNPPPSVDKVAERVSFLLKLSREAFKSDEEYVYASKLCVKAAAVFLDSKLIDVTLGDWGVRLADHFQQYKAHWICKLWKFQVSSSKTWLPFWDHILQSPAFGSSIIQKDAEPGVAVGILQGSTDVALKFQLPTKVQKPPASVSTHSSEPTKSERLVKELLETLTDTGQNQKLLQILLDKYVMRSTLLLTVSGNKNLSLAAEEFLKLATGQDDDTYEASIHFLVKNYTELVLSAMNSILSEAGPAEVTWLAAMPGLIRLALMVLDQVYSIHDGVETTGNKIILKLLRDYWIKSWTIVANVIKNIRTWTTEYAVSHVKLVLIAVLDFSQGLLSKFRLLDADLSSGFPEEGNWGSILAQPAISSVNNMGDLLQLAIPELLAMAHSIIVEILGLMQSFQVPIPETLSSLLEGLATKRLNSRLSIEQLRDLLAATDLTDEEINELIESRSKPSGARSFGGNTSQTDKHLPSTSHASKHQQLSIGDFFKSSGGQRPPVAPRPVVNNQVVPQTPQQQSGINLIRAQLSKQNHSQNAGRFPLPNVSNVNGTMIHPERPPGFNPQKPAKQLEESSDDEDEISALDSLGAQKKREEAANKLREAFEQSKARRATPHMMAEANSASQHRSIQQQRDHEARSMKARLNAQATELHREMLSWDYFASLPPFKAKISIPDTFHDVAEYQSIMTPLLFLEAWEQVQNAKEEMRKYSPDPFLLTFGKRVKVDGFTDVYVSLDKDSFSKSRIGEADLLLLTYDSSRSSEAVQPVASLPHCFARVKEGSIRNFNASAKSQFVDFQLRLTDQISFLHPLNAGSKVSGINIGNQRTVEREFTALIALPHYDLLPQILDAKLTIPPDRPNHVQRLKDNLNLNMSQAVAVSRSLSSQGFSLIQGPPGTGKTKTILSVIGAFFTSNSLVSQATGRDVDEAKRLLVCAPSNAAVDEIVLRLKDGVLDANGKKQSLRILRMGRYEMISEDVREVTLDELISKEMNQTAETADEQLRRDHTALTAQRNEVRDKLNSTESKLSVDEVRALTDRLKELSREIREKNYALDMQRDRLEQARKQKDVRFREQQSSIIKNAQVVCTTLSASAHPLLASLGVKFETVIIDEAAQSIELSALIPLKYGCKQCIMVGDPNQLPPTVISQEASRLKYEQSLFVRMFNLHKSANGAVSMLDTQFRMHPEISMFPSQEFYYGKLKDANGLAELLKRPWHERFSAWGPYSFFEVKGRHERGGKSLKNFAEADAALSLVREVKTAFPDIRNIGVISPYREQVRLIRQKFIDIFGSTITGTVSFNSVDGFQGQEKDIIIMSCVRASSKKNDAVGFLGDIRRMNVAITRAKASLWILGHPESLEVNSVWKALIDDAKARGRFVHQSASGRIKDSINDFENSRPPSAIPSITPSEGESSRSSTAETSSESSSLLSRSDSDSRRKKKKRKKNAPPALPEQPDREQITSEISNNNYTAASVPNVAAPRENDLPNNGASETGTRNSAGASNPTVTRDALATDRSTAREGHKKSFHNKANIFIPSKRRRGGKR